MKNKVSRYITAYAPSAATILGGLVLLFSPDTATVLIATIFGWCFLVAGIVLSLMAFAGNQSLWSILRGIGLVVVGLWLRRNPMSLAVAFGKLLGIGLVIGAISGYRKSNSSGGRTIYLAEGLFGLVLLIAPLTATRTVYAVIGVVLLIAGVVMLLNKLKNTDRLGPGGRDIIDV